ncbi:TetR/AcrR family transcriptional regulator [Actinomycetospora callitridis]|uniref:TetR/AcrR family transcriptional regulator n=1 Tax=Actinomycetospora callitridis TaxID=913944 RepID=UPI0023670FFF|nr:TetR/AcrR family transcriptional regulator [Actinomycetospora callitridis]MDD7919576.1 TetR/AcrR family transcriptional regulator [Actinomycetospora callitridis]
MSRRSTHHSDADVGGARDSERESGARPRRDRRSSRWDEHRRARRHELTAATIVAIRAHGAEVGMSQVAAQARTSKTVVYRHFADKNDLYLAVCDRVAATLVGQLQTAMREASDDPRRTLVSGIDAYLGLIAADPEVYRYVMRPPKLDRPESEDPVSDLCTVIGDHIAEIISTELRRQNRDPSPAQTWGHALVGMVRAAGDQWLATRPDLEREELAGQLADLAWSGLSRTVTPAAASSAS